MVEPAWMLPTNDASTLEAETVRFGAPDQPGLLTETQSQVNKMKK